MLFALAADAPTPKDVVLATMAASAALGGLVLVFLGLVIANYQSYSADTVASVKASKRRLAWPVLGIFVASVLSVALGFVWLEGSDGTALYAANNVVFAAELVGIVAVAVWTLLVMLGYR